MIRPNEDLARLLIRERLAEADLRRRRRATTRSIPRIGVRVPRAE